MAEGTRLATAKAGSRRGGKSFMYYIYILENEEGKHYIGYTSHLANRLKKHNTDSSRWTRYKGPWKIIYSEEYQTKSEAYRREKQIKSYKGGVAFKKLLGKLTVPHMAERVEVKI